MPPKTTNVNDAEPTTPASGTSPETNSNPATISTPNDLFSSNTNITYASIDESEGETAKVPTLPLEREPPPQNPPNAMALDTPIQPPRLTSLPSSASAPSYTTSQHPDITNESIQHKLSTGAADIASDSEHSEERIQIQTILTNYSNAQNEPQPPTIDADTAVAANNSHLLPSVPEPPSMVADQPTPKKVVATSAASNAPSPPTVKPLFEPPNLPPITRVPEIGHEYNVGRRTLPYCELYRFFQNNVAKIQIVRTTPGVPITFNDRNATFFVIGRCTHSALFSDGSDNQRLRQISIQPIHRFTPRMVAVAATMLEFCNPIFAVERDGISFTTLSKPRTGKGSPNILRAEMNSVTHGDCPRPHDQDVPCFEGVNGIDLNAYTNYPRRFVEYDEDDFVLVAFSFNGYLEASPIPNQPAAQRIGLSVRFTIRVAHVDDGDSDPTSSPLEPSLRDETPLSVIGTHGVADQASGVAVKQELKKRPSHRRASQHATSHRAAPITPMSHSAHATGWNLTNIHTVNSNDFASKQQNDAIYHVSANSHPRTDAIFTTVGKITASELHPTPKVSDTSRNSIAENPLLKNAQTPIRRFMPRMIAAICELLRFSSPTIPIFKDGILATTAIYPQDDEHFQIKYNEMDGHTHGPSPRPPNSNVPLFDGRAPFALSEYQKLPTLPEDLLPDDLVLIAFSLAGERLLGLNPVATGARRVRINVSFLILLYRPADNEEYAPPSRPRWLIDETLLAVKTAKIKQKPPLQFQKKKKHNRD
ncbi:hypothetical protein BDZ89DRAFT_1036370 [Hymenopellis radicata]|nr:hypothetical protein BDZ89DRAFT_1036370 [Hymenopellis radicata]